MTVLFLASCGGEDETTTKTPAHAITPETVDQITANTTEDLQTVASTGSDTTALGTALTGKALEDMKKQVATDLAAGKVKNREYRNISVRFEEFNPPFAEVFAEFDDYGYYVDANTGAALGQPPGTHVSFAMAVVEEDGRWKIQGIFSPSNPNTPRELSE